MSISTKNYYLKKYIIAGKSGHISMFLWGKAVTVSERKKNATFTHLVFASYKEKFDLSTFRQIVKIEVVWNVRKRYYWNSWGTDFCIIYRRRESLRKMVGFEDIT